LAETSLQEPDRHSPSPPHDTPATFPGDVSQPTGFVAPTQTSHLMWVPASELGLNLWMSVVKLCL